VKALRGAWNRLRAARATLALERPPFWLGLLSGATAAAWSSYVHWVVGELADRPGYRALVRVAPDQVWEALGMLGGLLQILAVLFGVLPAQRWIALAMVGFWLLVADGMHASSPSSPGVTFPLVLAAGNLVVCLLTPGRLLRP
jgi:hypothetical protein